MSNCVTSCHGLRNRLLHIAAGLTLIAGFSLFAVAGDKESTATDVSPTAIHVDLSQDWPWWRGSTHDGIA
ncbi:MAG: hypothetical protein WCO86_00985, partial [Planctomycetota bacterium]